MVDIDGEEDEQIENMTLEQYYIFNKLITIRNFLKVVTSENFENLKGIQITNSIMTHTKKTCRNRLMEYFMHSVNLLTALFLLLLWIIDYPWYFSIFSILLLAVIHYWYASHDFTLGKSSISGLHHLVPKHLIEVFSGYDQIEVVKAGNSYRIGDKEQYLNLRLYNQEVIFELKSREWINDPSQLNENINTVVFDFLLWFELIFCIDPQTQYDFYTASDHKKYEAILSAAREGLIQTKNDPRLSKMMSSYCNIPVEGLVI